ncbi:MAG: hypothetical protein NTZ69_06400 [Bacteroidia bacterium]|nr:hypothetical protein [Bacteroidia bacterium]
MKYLILISVFLIAISSSAQECTNESLLKTPGIWTESGGSTSGIAAADLAKEKKVVAAIQTMIKSQFTPMGVRARINGSYFRSESYMPVNSYSFNIIPLNFYCDGNRMKTADETSTYFQISVNFFDVDIYDTAKGDRAMAEGFNVIHNLPVEKDGYWYLKEVDSGMGFGMVGKSCGWLITYDGKLPFAYVTKKEFLEKRKKNVTNSMHNAEAGFKDALKNIEMEKGFKETEYKNDPDKLKKYMEMSYQYTKDKFEKLLANNEKNYKPEFDKIETQLRMSAEELNQQAIVKLDQNANLSSYHFTDNNDPFGEILIKPNPGYFNMKLPRSSPQFIWVNVIWNHHEPIASMFREDIMKAVDFATLKSMLGK